MKSVLDFLGVYFIVVPKGVNPAITLWNNSQYEKDLTKIYEDEGNDVYQLLTAIPRFGLYWDIRDGVSDEESLQAIENQSVNFKNTLLIQEQLSETFVPGTGSADLVSSDLNNLSFRVQTDRPAVFYLSDGNFPGWHASVNGKETPVLHANYNFRGVLVPAGRSDIEFWYLPKSVIVGGIVSILGIVVTVGFVIVDNIIQSRKKGE